MKKLTSLFLLPFWVWCLLFFSNCTVNKNQIMPATLEFPDSIFQKIGDLPIEIAYHYDVLETASHSFYSNKERSLPFKLIRVLILNNGIETLYFPNNFTILEESGVVIPFTREETLALLFQEDERWVTANGETLIPESNSKIALNAKRKLSKAIKNNYLKNSSVFPGEGLIGLIALPLKENVPLNFRFYKPKYYKPHQCY